VRAALEPVMPPGLSVVSTLEVPRRDPALATLFSHAVYQIALAGIEQAEIEARVTELMDKSEVPVHFRRKTYDLRPLIGSLALAPAQGTQAVILEATLLRDERGRTGRPDVLIQALDLEPYARQMVRQKLVFQLD